MMSTMNTEDSQLFDVNWLYRMSHIVKVDVTEHVLVLLRFYRPLNPVGSRQAWSVCLTTLFWGQA